MFELLAIGEINVDIILSGMKSIPISGQEQLAAAFHQCLGSSTAITACVASSLGLRTAFVGRAGIDDFGRLSLSTFARYGVDTTGVLTQDDWHTGVTISMSTAKDRAMATFCGDTIDKVTAKDVDLATRKAKHLHIGAFYLQTALRSDIPALFRQAHALGMTTSLDTGWCENGAWDDHLSDALCHTDYFFPNESEALAITGASDIPSAARALAQIGCGAVIKCGQDGAMALLSPTSALLHAPAYPTHVIDTTGAGDSFNAGFLYGMLNGYSPETCLQYGNATGSVSVTQPGGTFQCPTLLNVKELLRQ